MRRPFQETKLGAWQTRRINGSVAGALLMMAATAHADGLPERVEKAAQERVATGDYQTLVVAVVDGDQTKVAVFGKLDDGNTPDGDTVYEIGSITKTFTATLLADAVRSGRLTLDTPVAQLLPDFSIPSRSDIQITLDNLATQHSGLPRLPSNLLPGDAANPYADIATELTNEPRGRSPALHAWLTSTIARHATDDRARHARTLPQR